MASYLGGAQPGRGNGLCALLPSSVLSRFWGPSGTSVSHTHPGTRPVGDWSLAVSAITLTQCARYLAGAPAPHEAPALLMTPEPLRPTAARDTSSGAAS